MKTTKRSFYPTVRPLPGWMATFVSLFLFTACGGGGGSESDRSAITDELAASEFFGMALTDTDEGGILSKTGAESSDGMIEKELLAPAEGTASLPFLWYRTGVQRVTRDLDIQITGDTATTTVIDHLSGTLRVFREPGTRWDKPFEETFTRYAEFTRNPATEQPPRWRLTRISPAEISLGDPSLQTVRVESVRAFRCLQIEEDGETCADWENSEKVWESLSPESLFAVPDELPAFSPGDMILVEATVSNADAGYSPSEFVFLHRPGTRPGSLFGRVRDRMFDDGTHGDRSGADGVYSRTYSIVSNSGRHFAVVDVMNAAAFMEEAAPYNSTGWGMPYRVTAE